MSPAKSVVAVWRDAVRDSELDRTAKLVGHTLSTYANANGTAYPSRRVLAEGASLGRGLRAVDAALRKLQDAGFLAIERSRGRSSHGYTLTLPPTAHEMRRSEWETAQRVRGQRRTDRPPTAHESTFNGARRAPKSVESVESGRRGALSAPSPLPEDECMGCREVRPLHTLGDGRMVCSECLEEAS